MFDFFTKIFKYPELRNKIIFILFIFLVYRILASIPVPGIDLERLKLFFQNNQFFGFINIFTGGSFDNFSIVMLGLGPYITAIIILQLLTMVFPRLKEIYQEEGEEGRKKFYLYSKVLTVPLASLQAYGFILLLRNQGALGVVSAADLITTILIVTGGAMILVWFGDLITEKGLGNGASLLIFAGIIASIPQAVGQIFVTYNPRDIPNYLTFVIVAFLIILGIVFINEAQRNIPVSYAKLLRGGRFYGGQQSYLPLRVNMAGVIPIIFALSVILFPTMIGNILVQTKSEILRNIGFFLRDLFNSNILYGLFYFVLVFLFTFFYTAITFEPKTTAQNIQRAGGFIPGIRPGKPTIDYLSYIVTRITLPGAIFLGIIAVSPIFVQSLTGLAALTIGGTAVLIVVSVVLETYKQIKGEIAMREYQGL